MADLDAVAVEGEQAGGGEAFDDGCRGELVAVDAAFGVLGAFAGAGEAEQDLAGLPALVGVQAGVGVLGGLGDGAGDAAGSRGSWSA